MPPTGGPATPLQLRLENLSNSCFNRVTALRNVTLTIPHGTTGSRDELAAGAR
jgi:hypothetical protein